MIGSTKDKETEIDNKTLEWYSYLDVKSCDYMPVAESGTRKPGLRMSCIYGSTSNWMQQKNSAFVFYLQELQTPKRETFD